LASSPRKILRSAPADAIIGSYRTGFEVSGSGLRVRVLGSALRVRVYAVLGSGFRFKVEGLRFRLFKFRV